MKTITINNKEYKIKYTIRALFIFEQITGKAFNIQTLLDNYVFFYSMILANNPDDVLDWDDFINALDKDPELLQKLTATNEEYMKKDDIFGEESTGTEEKKS